MVMAIRTPLIPGALRVSRRERTERPRSVRFPLGSGVLTGSAPETGTLPLKRLREARVTFVPAKVTKTMVPAGWPAAAAPRQVPEPGDVLGARTNRPSMAWSRSLGIHASRPLRATPASATLQGHVSETARRSAASLPRAGASSCDVAKRRAVVRSPWWRGGWWRAQGRIGPDGRSSRDGTGCPFTAAPSTSPAAGTPARQRRAGAPPRGVLSLVPFSGQAEKGTRAGRAETCGSAVVPRRGTREHEVPFELLGTTEDRAESHILGGPSHA